MSGIYRSTLTAVLAVAMLSALPGAYAGSSLYKWEDDQGITHYSERPPAGVSNFEKVNAEIAPGNAPVDYKPAGAAETQQKSSDVAAETAAAAAASEQAQASTSASDERCEKARKNLEALTSFARIRVKDPDGQVRFLSEQEVNTRKMEAQALLQDECSN